MMTRTATILTLTVATVPFPGAGGSHMQHEEFGGRYDLGASGMSPVPFQLPSNPAPMREPVFGVMVCGGGDGWETIDGVDSPGPDSVGGECPGILVPCGDKVQAWIRDDVNGDASFAICIDTNVDGDCRLENQRDHRYFHTCGDVSSGIEDPDLAFTHYGPTGVFAVWVMRETSAPNACPATTGWVGGYVERVTGPPQCSDGLDIDGNGVDDYPCDPGCDSPDDDCERTPECRDGIDNDGNGLRDYPQDPGCRFADQWVENNPYTH